MSSIARVYYFSLVATITQPHTTPLVLNIPQDLLFAPKDGQTYYLEDKDLVFAQQPLEGPSLADYLISSSSTLKPPTLVYGRRFGHDKLMQIALDHFLQVVHYRKGPATVGFFDDGEEHRYTEDDWEYEHPNIAETIFDYDFLVAIRDQRKSEYGLTVGSNYLKVIDKEALQKPEVLIASNEPAKWYLYCKKWMWRWVAPPKTKSKTNLKSKT